MIVPTILAIVTVIIEVNTKKESDGNQKNIVCFLKCLLHLPILKSFQTFIFARSLWKVVKEKEKVEDFASRINKWIEDSGSFLLDDEWTWAKIELHFKGRVLEEDSKVLQVLFKQHYQDCFNGQPSVKLKALTDAHQMEKEVDLARVKSEIQEFKIFEAFGESAPQFILQSCAILHKNPTLSEGATTNNLFKDYYFFLIGHEKG
jgi:hypothetical protein